MIREYPIASVAVPAHNEEPVLERSLQRLLADAAPGELDVIVVANACTDATAEVARRAGVRVLESPVPGKVAALLRGDAHSCVFPRVYLDADVELSVGSVRALIAALGSAKRTGLRSSPQAGPHCGLLGSPACARRSPAVGRPGSGADWRGCLRVVQARSCPGVPAAQCRIRRRMGAQHLYAHRADGGRGGALGGTAGADRHRILGP
jgi:cellulose synthase/poly-beta-1,6-N-acetylglucosamine synthase-like glycosyltransferase